mmetsp:Transcript_13340/g.36788  ORF Transcript_13340/g.36788 Transcript_13340/m.36788 type:complete len:114 (-) Transcript_13340:799-1140(-)
MFGQSHNRSTEIAHLVPAGKMATHSYWFVTDFLFGIDEKRSWDETTRLLHGSKKTRKKADRVGKTGIKHMVTNKILLAGQKHFFDVAPCLVIVPIMNRQSALDWGGEEYHALC